eukprot:TRINITY_DN70158_c0_g1_i1.p1 TRINITY_DN70158_c0_g1~~TRINITY_DN70158_c0_g1_i1.p1  ORF type:complete len:261 (+),score=73.42 TRINITY_DN70158_c0_g1_i1:73-783(+)
MAAAGALCEPTHSVDRSTRRVHLGPGAGHEHTASVLLLHGFGDTAAGWFDPCYYWAQRLPHVRFVLPTAPLCPEMGTTSWFPFMGPNRRKGFAESAAALREIIDAEAAAVGSHNRVVVAGFSQGGALAYELGLGSPKQPLGGVVALSTFMPQATAEGARGPALQTPVLICHGTLDDRIPGGSRGAEQTRDRLAASGATDVTLRVYEGLGHAASQEEVADVLEFLRRVLPQPPAPKL